MQRKELVEPDNNSIHRFVGLEHIDSGNISLQRWGNSSDLRSTKSKFKAGDILYGKLRPYLDKVVLAEWNGICSTDIMVLITNAEKAVANFVAHLLHSKNFVEHAMQSTSGTNHPRTSWDLIKNFQFACPPLPEQRRIAEILGTVDEAIQLEEQRKQKFGRIKKGLMNELLTGKRRTKV